MKSSLRQKLRPRSRSGIAAAFSAALALLAGDLEPTHAAPGGSRGKLPPPALKAPPFSGQIPHRAPFKPDKEKSRFFARIATFSVFLNTDIDAETVAEIVAATDDGMTLVYTDSEQELLGFVDIADPENPLPAGTAPLEGEPTSVAVVGPYALAAVVTDDTFTDPKGRLEIFDIATRSRVRVLHLPGQPDAIAVSPNRRFAAIAIENERDEDLGDGRPGQPGNPPGSLTIVDLAGPVSNWKTRQVDLTGIADKFPEDPEPEFVSINRLNVAAVTLQENNHVVLVHLPSGRVIGDFSADSVDLDRIDATENDLIEQVESLEGLPREPDAIAWVGPFRLATADEGDLDGGSRGFTIFDIRGNVRFTSGSNDDQLTAMIGHYPEDRSENKGNEPEGVAFARYGRERLLFVGSERSSVISVYEIGRRGQPRFLQVLPAGLGPEGLLPIPKRNLLVVASEEDDRGDKFRASITLYRRDAAEPTYPTIASLDRPDGTPIPWGALSAVAVDPGEPKRAWTVHDSFYRKSRIYQVDTSGEPALIESETLLSDANGAFAAALAAEADSAALPDFDPDALLEDDGSVNIDAEGLARRADGGFWIASEGSGTVGDEDDRPIESRNWLLRVDGAGTIQEVVGLPDATDARQRRFGLEGVASVGSGADEVLYVCFQREWGVDAPEAGADPAGFARIGRYETATGEWTFLYYPLDPRESPNGGWVGLSEIVALDGETFLVLERDNQGGPDARIKRVYSFDIGGLAPLPEAPIGEVPAFPVVEKHLARDLIPDLLADNGAVIEKVEGLAVFADGEALLATDNDGVDDASGETLFRNIGEL